MTFCWLDGDHFDIRILGSQKFAGAADGSAGAQRNKEMRNPALCLFPDLRSSRFQVRFDVLLVFVLVRQSVFIAGSFGVSLGEIDRTIAQSRRRTKFV